MAIRAPRLLAAALMAALAACLLTTWLLPVSAGWRVALCLIELAYAVPAGIIWWQSRPSRLRLGPDGRLKLWFPAGGRVALELRRDATVHGMFVVLPLTRRVGFSRHILLSRNQLAGDDFRRLRRWLRTLPRAS